MPGVDTPVFPSRLPESEKGLARGHLRAQFVTSIDKEMLIFLGFINLSQVANASSILVYCNIYFVEEVARVLIYSHTFVELYGLPFVGAKMRALFEIWYRLNFSRE